MDISIEKLRNKFKWLKNEWSAKTIRAKNGSGLEPDEEPYWYQILNPIFTETNKPLNLVSSAMDTSFVGEEDSSASSDDELVSRADDETEPQAFNEEGSQDIEAGVDTLRKKLIAPPHKKSRRVRSYKQGLGEIARAIKASVDAQDRRHKEQLKANDERERRMTEFRAKEAEKDREHEFRMAQLFMSTRQSSTPRPFEMHPQQSLSQVWNMNPSTNRVNMDLSFRSMGRSPFSVPSCKPPSLSGQS